MIKLISDTVREVSDVFPVTHTYVAQGILVRYYADLLNPSNVAARAIKERVPSLLNEEIHKLPPELRHLTAKQVAVTLVSIIDQRLPQEVAFQYQDKIEREIMILLEMNRAKKLSQPATTRPESKKENP